MKPTNDGSTIVLSLERYQDLLTSEVKIQQIESARLTMEGYKFTNFIEAMFPYPEATPDA